jgi:hypothetical protein
MNMNQFDPSKMDPKLLMELSQLVQQLPPEHLSRMQTLMHNMMAGIDVRKDMEDFEKSLPPNFRIRLATLFASNADKLAPFANPGSMSEPIDVTPTPAQSSGEMDVYQARITILRAVADGRISPEEAEKLLFQS